jgi:hypothetical protein
MKNSEKNNDADKFSISTKKWVDLSDNIINQILPTLNGLTLIQIEAILTGVKSRIMLSIPMRLPDLD